MGGNKYTLISSFIFQNQKEIKPLRVVKSVHVLLAYSFFKRAVEKFLPSQLSTNLSHTFHLVNSLQTL